MRSIVLVRTGGGVGRGVDSRPGAARPKAERSEVPRVAVDRVVRVGKDLVMVLVIKSVCGGLEDASQKYCQDLIRKG